MATKSSSVLDQMKLDAGQKAKLNDIDKKQMQLEQGDQQALIEYETTVQDMLDGKTDVKVEDLSKLERGIERGRQFRGEITDLAQSLTLELNELGQFFGNASQYQGMEKWVSYLSTRAADRMRLGRVKSADIKANLQTILDYGNHMVQKLYSATLENMECMERVGATFKLTSEKLEQNQPLYEDWRGQREKAERELKEHQDKMDTAGETQFAQLAVQKTELEAKLHESKTNENHYFAIVDKAKQALPIQRTHLKAYQDSVDALMQFKTRLEQDINNVTSVYLSAPTAIKTALSMKAASQYDKGLKYATDKATESVLSSVAGILDETATRAERPLIEPDRLDAYRKAQHEMRASFETRVDALRKKYAAPGSPN